MKSGSHAFIHPCDTPLSAALRFCSELIAWIAGPWALAGLSGWLVVPELVVLVGSASVFSTQNDKRTVIVPTPGPIRVLVESLQYLVAAIAPWFVWSTPLSIVTTLVVVTSVGVGVPRLIWLLKGAPERNEQRIGSGPPNGRSGA